jgi:hypothetical protein
MNPRFASIAFLLLLTLAAGFVWSSSSALPAVVASHFGASGAADGFMLRADYVLTMLLTLVGVALLVAFLPFALPHLGDGSINLPNRDYWLAPARRAQTFAFLRLHGLSFASALVAFLAYVHWLVVQANLRQPPQLSTPAIIAALLVFLAILAIWLIVLFARFRQSS